jgi:hypothetical protein
MEDGWGSLLVTWSIERGAEQMTLGSEALAGLRFVSAAPALPITVTTADALQQSPAHPSSLREGPGVSSGGLIRRSIMFG